MNEYNDILGNIKEIRLSMGFGQEYMATKLGVTQACYANWENGKRELTYNNLLRISKCLECDVVDIITHNWQNDSTEKPKAHVNEKVSITFEVDPHQRDYLLHLVMGDKLTK